MSNLYDYYDYTYYDVMKNGTHNENLQTSVKPFKGVRNYRQSLHANKLYCILIASTRL